MMWFKLSLIKSRHDYEYRYGNQYHLRRWVNGNQSSLDAHIENAYRTLNLPPIDSIRWVSPIESDGFRELAGMEYFSETGRYDVVNAWSGFWPRR